jgi:hypothetical protein|tara:strand:- start:1170 stop:1517 length:348 start_codon:yes stop_codon:yes gene_type:complete
MSILKRFAEECLKDITYPNKPKSWHVQGMLKDKSNQTFKFDVRGMSKANENKLEKQGKLNSKAEKMVFETTTYWVIFDTQEINKYIEKHNITDLLFEDLLNNLEWNIVLPKLSKS